MMEPWIQIEEITKSYRDVKAVDRLSLVLHPGEIYGFLGLNGAGKTTTIRILLGLIRPASGRVLIHGKELSKHPADFWNCIGSQVETPHAYPDLTVRENLEAFRCLRNLRDRSVVDQAIERLGLAAYADRKAALLSLGNNQRLGLAKALLHRPAILILDEPANGLDPAGIVEIRNLLTELAENGSLVFVSSHILSEVARMADRIGILHKGKLIEEGTKDALCLKMRETLSIRLRDPRQGLRILAEAGYRPVLVDDSIQLDDAGAIARPENIATLLVNQGAPPFFLGAEEEKLEDFFLRITREERRQA
jgi:ABC-2 type transport system ATP-binding protein